ncbi:MAG TPA: hypothetical protein VF647_17965 [Longimicrobium sp.]|jgi:hypothetical protein
MIWLGESRGHLSDYVTQRWVEVTGRSVDLGEHPWLAGPVGDVRGIGREFFAELARREGLELRQGADSGERGLIVDFAALAAPDFDPGQVDPSVIDFYARTSAYELDAWAEWHGAFRPFGRLLGHLFSRRLQQLNVPLSSLDTSRGVTSDVIQLVEPATGKVRRTAWVRVLLGTGNVLYAGEYSLAAAPGRRGQCLKVVFPLPNGNAILLMRPEAHADGSLSVVSEGEGFGESGFYFTVHDRRGRVRARYVRAMQERIRVYPAEHGAVRADHVLTLWGATFLRLHYRLRRKAPAAEVLAAS